MSVFFDIMTQKNTYQPHRENCRKVMTPGVDLPDGDSVTAGLLVDHIESRNFPVSSKLCKLTS